MAIYATCHRCGAEYEVAIWDTAPNPVSYCSECRAEVPEFCLWDVSKLDTSHPEMPDDHPLGDDERWAVRNRYQDRETYISYLKASWDGSPPDDWEFVDLPDEECWEIFVHTVDDEEAVAEARAEVRERKS